MCKVAGWQQDIVKLVGSCSLLHDCCPLLPQSGAIHMALGSFAEGTAQYEAALKIAPSHPAALLGAAESLAAAAGMHARQGALGALRS